MRLSRALLAPLLFSVARCATAPSAVVPKAPPPTAEEVFQRELAPHGEWIVITRYGRVWVPRPAVVGENFRPYVTAGYWVSTNSGWSFESGWSWGWLPFHYGRWFLDSSYGWVWVPDKTWAPAWVTWRYGGGYIGWTPLAPPGADLQVEVYHPNWYFVETRQFVARDFQQHAVSPEKHPVAFRAALALGSQPSSTGPWPAGPDPLQLSQELGQAIQSQQVVLPKPGEMAPHRLQGIASAKPKLGSALPAQSVAPKQPVVATGSSPPQQTTPPKELPTVAPKQPVVATASSPPQQTALPKEPPNSEQPAAPVAESSSKTPFYRLTENKVGHSSKHRGKSESNSRRRRHRGGASLRDPG